MEEIGPYDDFSMTHGMCDTCAGKDPFAHDLVEHATALRKIMRALKDAAWQGDFEAATAVVDKAIAANCRPVDILVGMVSPLLYEIGEAWKRGAITVEDEHRFSAFSEKVVQLVEARIDAAGAPGARPGAALMFLMNAPGNRHHLALRILSIWLESHGARVQVVEDDVTGEEFLRSIAAKRPKYLLISMALIDQHDRVTDIVRTVQSLPEDIRPRTIVGGYPVKAGFVREIPGAELLTNITALHIA